MSSGARYSGVPQSVHVRSTIFLANPKSHTCHKRDATEAESLTLQNPSSRVIKGPQELVKGHQELIKHTLQKPSSRVIKGHQGLNGSSMGRQELIKHALQKPSSRVIKGDQGLNGSSMGRQELIKHALQKPSSRVIKGRQGLIKGSSRGHQAHLAEAARVEEQILGLEIAVDDLMRETISGRQRRRRSG
jgi:hypothetical protein